VLEQVPGATYVEGFLDNPVLRHAWNKVDGQYFDVTAEKASPGGWHQAYHVLIDIDAADVAAYQAAIQKTNMVAKVYFIKHMYSKRGKIAPSFLPAFIMRYCDLND
jgi:hypothetical protein